MEYEIREIKESLEEIANCIETVELDEVEDSLKSIEKNIKTIEEENEEFNESFEKLQDDYDDLSLNTFNIAGNWRDEEKSKILWGFHEYFTLEKLQELDKKFNIPERCKYT